MTGHARLSHGRLRASGTFPEPTWVRLAQIGVGAVTLPMNSGTVWDTSWMT